MRALKDNPNIDHSDPSNYPDGRVKDNNGTGNGTAVNERTKGDWHQAIAKLMRKYNIVPNGLPDNETNGFQIVEALKALASKNDYIYPLTTDGTTLNIDIKLTLMEENEYLTCLASTNKTAETQIKGIGAGTLAVAYSGNFKANEYVRVIRTNVGVSIIRVADWNSLNAMVGDFLYLKKADQSEEDAGTSDTVATTPKVNKVTFTKRVNGTDSPTYLASHTQNGLLSKEFWDIINTIGANPIKNTGWFSGLNIGSTPVGTNFAVNNNITAAQVTFNDVAGLTVVRCTMANAVTGNYKVDATFESLSTFDPDSRVLPGVFKPISTTVFDIAFRESSVGNQNLKVHLTITQI